MDKLMSIMLIVVFVSVSSLVFSFFQATSVAEGYEEVSEVFLLEEMRTSSMSLESSSYVAGSSGNLDLVQVLAMKCVYGDEEGIVQISDIEGIELYPEDYLEYYLEETITQDYMIEIDCVPDSEDTGLKNIGSISGEEVIVEEFQTPLPGGTMTTVRIYR